MHKAQDVLYVQAKWLMSKGSHNSLTLRSEFSWNDLIQLYLKSVNVWCKSVKILFTEKSAWQTVLFPEVFCSAKIHCCSAQETDWALLSSPILIFKISTLTKPKLNPRGVSREEISSQAPCFKLTSSPSKWLTSKRRVKWCFDLWYCPLTTPIGSVSLPWLWWVIKRPLRSPRSDKEAQCLQDTLNVCPSVVLF